MMEEKKIAFVAWIYIRMLMTFMHNYCQRSIRTLLTSYVPLSVETSVDILVTTS